jgi:hypothetical protein
MGALPICVRKNNSSIHHRLLQRSGVPSNDEKFVQQLSGLEIPRLNRCLAKTLIFIICWCESSVV